MEKLTQFSQNSGTVNQNEVIFDILPFFNKMEGKKKKGIQQRWKINSPWKGNEARKERKSSVQIVRINCWIKSSQKIEDLYLAVPMLKLKIMRTWIHSVCVYNQCINQCLLPVTHTQTYAVARNSNHVYISCLQITCSGFADINWHWLGNSGFSTGWLPVSSTLLELASWPEWAHFMAKADTKESKPKCACKSPALSWHCLLIHYLKNQVAWPNISRGSEYTVCLWNILQVLKGKGLGKE